ncbi:MAG: type II secretion system F family protein [Clostridia bacterium]|nr:type II secretion system F family protein [Clostridia bacterium]
MIKYIIILSIELLMLTILYIIFYNLLKSSKNIKFRIESSNQNILFKKVSDIVNVMYIKNLLKTSNKYVTPINIIFISIIFFLISFVLIYSFLKVFIAAIIFSLPFLILPYISLKILIRFEKSKIKRQLPVFVVNLKGHITNENNIILAIKQTTIEEPLKKYILKFLISVERGMNINDAFEFLKNEVNVKEFSNLIEAFKICYLNGGNFVAILDKFLLRINKQLIQEEKEKEKSLSSIITLMVMMLLNVFLIITYVYGSKENINIIKETLSGRLILDINAICCVMCLLFLYKMYKMED